MNLTEVRFRRLDPRSLAEARRLGDVSPIFVDSLEKMRKSQVLYKE